MLSCQALIMATAMAVSAGTLVLLDLLREKNFTTIPIPRNHQDSRKQTLKSCLSSGLGNEKKKGGMKKKVKFADDVKEYSSGNGQDKVSRIRTSSCGSEIPEITGMPANRVALYTGMLKDRLHRMECSY